VKRTLAASALLFLGLSAHAQTSQGPEGDDGVKTLTMRYQLSAPFPLTITGTWQTVDGTATAADNDYIPATGTFVIPADTLESNEISFQVVGDRKIELDETFTIVASNVQNGIPPVPLTLTILNDDVAATSVADASGSEGNAGTTPMTFVVTLTSLSDIPIQASYFSGNGTATGGEDFQPAQGTLTFSPGVTQQNVTVNVIGDTTFESDETFTLTVTPAGGTASTGTGTILNDDSRPPTGIIIVGGANQQGRLGQPLAQPLVVQVVDETEAPVAGSVVQWSVTRGEADLNPSTSITGADGRASTIATPRSIGEIDIRATAGNLDPVTFTINASTSFELRARGPVAVPIARALDRICATDQQNFAGPCRALANLSDSDLTPALERVAPQQSGAEAKVATEVVGAVTAGVAARLSAVRNGVDRFSIQQLALNINGRAIPIGAIASALFPQDAQTDAGGVEESDYSGWSAFVSGNLGDGERIARDGQLGFDLGSRGLMFGVDRLFGGSIFGASLHLTQIDADLSSDTGSVDTSGYALSLYASRGGFFAGSSPNASFDGLHLDGSLTYGRNTYEAEHVVEIAGLPLSRATSENDANVFALTAGTGLEAHRGRTDFDFSLSGTWSRANIDDLTEEGSGPLILFVEGHDVKSLTATAGFNVRSAFAVPFGTLLPSFRAEMLHEFEDGARLVTARFIRDTLGTEFTVPLDRVDRNYGRIGAGLQGVFPYGWSASVEATQDVLRSDLHFRTVQFTLYKSF
jgi:outer membrane autotransporter protein